MSLKESLVENCLILELRTQGFDLLHHLCQGIDFSMSATILDQIFNVKVNHTEVCYEPLNDCASAHVDSYSTFDVSTTTKSKHPIRGCSLNETPPLHYNKGCPCQRNTKELLSISYLGLDEHIMSTMMRRFLRLFWTTRARSMSLFAMPLYHM